MFNVGTKLQLRKLYMTLKRTKTNTFHTWCTQKTRLIKKSYRIGRKNNLFDRYI